MFNLLPYHGILLVLGFVGVLAYLYGTFKKDSDEASAQSNQILRGLIDDQKKEIDALRTEVNELRTKVDRNQNLERIMQSALVEYFQANPDIAKKLKKN